MRSMVAGAGSRAPSVGFAATSPVTDGEGSGL